MYNELVQKSTTETINEGDELYVDQGGAENQLGLNAPLLANFH